MGTPVSSTTKTDRHDITEILLKVALSTIKKTYNIINVDDFYLQGAENKLCRIRQLPYPCERVSEENSC